MKYIVGLPLDPETFIETLHWGCLNISATTLAMYPTGTRSDTSFFRWLATGALSNTTSSLSSASVLCLSTLPPREEARTIVLHAAAQSLGLPSAALCSSAAKLADELRRSSGTALSLLSACWTRSLSDLVLDMQIQEQARARFFASVTDSAPSEVASAWANYTQLMMVRLCSDEQKKLALSKLVSVSPRPCALFWSCQCMLTRTFDCAR